MVRHSYMRFWLAVDIRWFRCNLLPSKTSGQSSFSGLNFDDWMPTFLLSVDLCWFHSSRLNAYTSGQSSSSISNQDDWIPTFLLSVDLCWFHSLRLNVSTPGRCHVIWTVLFTWIFPRKNRPLVTTQKEPSPSCHIVDILGVISSSTSSRIRTVSSDVNIVTPFMIAHRRMAAPSL